MTATGLLFLLTNMLGYGAVVWWVWLETKKQEPGTNRENHKKKYTPYSGFPNKVNSERTSVG